MIATSVGKLSGSYINNSFTGPFRDLMNKTCKVLVGITETHSTSDARFKERSRTRKAEGYHALILIPDVYHSVKFIITGINSVYTQKVVPVAPEISHRGIHFFTGVEPGYGLF